LALAIPLIIRARPAKKGNKHKKTPKKKFFRRLELFKPRGEAELIQNVPFRTGFVDGTAQYWKKVLSFDM